MSNVSQVHKLLLHNQQLHLPGANFYQSLAGQVSSQRVKMFIDTFVKHDTERYNSLDHYIGKAPTKILNTYF
ncbi:MAG: hypothetical protein ACI9C4_000587 [Paraglaciecola sp.]|jgi:hypothetical protein